MADADALTPEAADSPSTKLAAEKDRECPFCNIKFTSSSLGRHLDLYIREKNPKPPDGKHDADEIRKLRGNVTRRQARTSTAKREGSTPTSSQPTAFREHRSPSTSAASIPRSQRNGGTVKMSMNKPDWTATGVINEIPPTYTNGSADHARIRSPPRKVSVKEEVSRKHVALEEKDRARAAEYALKEVLGNVKAANMRAHPQSPFQFNLFSLSFPTMCLRCLSAPPRLSFGTTVSKDRSWSIDPPNSYQYEALRRWLSNNIRDWRIRRKALGLVRSMEPVSASSDKDHVPDWSMTDPEADQHEAACLTHLDDAYRSWHSLSDMQKHEKWHSECVTALTQEQDHHRETRDRMERLENQVQSLQAELNLRNNDQPASSIPLSKQTALQTFDRYTDLAAWDYDKLITKWRTQVQSERAQQHPLPPAPPSPWTASTPDSARSPLYVNGTNPYLRFQQHASRVEHARSGTNGVDEDEHLTDAPGDEDDTEPAAAIDRNVLDPNLRERQEASKDTVMGNGVSQNGE